MSDRTPGAQPALSATATAETDPPTDDKRFSQADLDNLIKDRLERQRRALETQKQEERQAAETKALEEGREYEKLAAQRAKEIDQLKPRAGLAASYEQGVSKLMLKATESLPSTIQTILNKLSLPDQLDWLSENLDSVKAPAVASGSTDMNAWSRSSPGATGALTDEEFLAKKRREMNY
jgi:hypothetical protein